MISANSTGVATLLPCALMPQQQWELSEKSVHYLYVHPIWSFSTHDSVPLMYKYSFFPSSPEVDFLIQTGNERISRVNANAVVDSLLLR